jgi:outer membrane murein-binding lipoprotein Lpp
MRAKQVGVRWGILASVLCLLAASGCATQDQVDQMATEMQQMRAQSLRREAELESLTQRLIALQTELDRLGPGGERDALIDSMHRLADSNDALRHSMGPRSGANGPWGDADSRQHAVAPTNDDAELRHLVRQLRQIVHGREALTPVQQQLLLRALRPQRELDRENPWDTKIDPNSPWEPATDVNVVGPKLDRSNPWH